MRVELSGSGPNRPVVLAAGEGAFLYILGPGIREFLRKSIAPLRLLSLDREGVVTVLRSGRAHLGVAALDVVPPDLQATLLCKVEQVVALPQDHPLARKRRLTIKDLAGTRLVVPTAERPHRQMLSAALRTANVTWEVAVEASGWELMLHFVKLGMGIAVVNSVCNNPRGLITRPLPELANVHYYLLHLDSGKRSETQQELAHLLLKHAMR